MAHAQHHDAPGEYPTPRADADLDKSQPTEALATSFAPVNFSEVSYFGIEICSGTGGLTAQLRLHGLPGSFGVDHIVKAGCKAPICKLNLEKEDNIALVLEWVRHHKCKYVHLGVPCGTASRAREIPLPGGPYPLRSPEHPDGLPNLSQRDQERVHKANLVYAAACRIILACHASGTAWTLENPTNSLFWLTSFWRCVMKQTDPWYATFHSCMYGGARAKSTTLAGSMAKLTTLSVDCDKQHKHLPWGKTSTGFATAEETEYPLGLCLALAQVVQEELGLTATPPLTSPDKRARAATFKQTKKSLAFMPDYSHVETAKFQTQPTFAIKDKLPHAVGDVPQHARILRITTPKMGGSSGGCDEYEVAFGVPWTEENFLEEVFRRGHPASLFDSVSDTMRAAITANASLRPEAIISYRAKWLKKWMDRANDLKAQESKLREGISEQKKSILKGKRLALFEEILTAEGYPDHLLPRDTLNGFDLVGMCGNSPALPDDFQPASLSVEDLASNAWRSNKAILHSTKSSGCPLVDAELWFKTCEEEKKGWLTRFQKAPQDGGRVSRRFGIVQGSKVRPIDNYSESQVNDAATITNKCTVDGVDTIAAMASALMKDLKAASRSSELHGAALDLKSAYRQLPVSDSSLRWARIAAYNPDSKETVCFQQYTLPFGARGSVVAFLRCARALQWLAHKLYIVCSCYFDDYVCISPVELAANTEATMKCLLQLLGWEFDGDGEKSDSMTSTVSALGVVVTLSRSRDGVIEIENTEKRKKEIAKTIAELLVSGKITVPEASSLKGRLGFAEGQLFGRVTRKLIGELGRYIHNPPLDMTLVPSAVDSMSVVKSRILSARARTVDTSSDQVYFLFTDACFASEDGEGGLGAVLFNPAGTVEKWFGCRVQREVCDSISSEGQKQIIGELETLAVLVALQLWGPELRSKHLMTFIDNEGCRYLILRGRAENKNLSKLVHQIARSEEDSSLFIWYARVPTECNIADAPSRGKSHELLHEAQRVKEIPDLKKVINDLRDAEV